MKSLKKGLSVTIQLPLGRLFD